MNNDKWQYLFVFCFYDDDYLDVDIFT